MKKKGLNTFLGDQTSCWNVLIITMLTISDVLNSGFIKELDMSNGVSSYRGCFMSGMGNVNIVLVNGINNILGYDYLIDCNSSKRIFKKRRYIMIVDNNNNNNIGNNIIENNNIDLCGMQLNLKRPSIDRVYLLQQECVYRIRPYIYTGDGFWLRYAHFEKHIKNKCDVKIIDYQVEISWSKLPFLYKLSDAPYYIASKIFSSLK